MSERAYRFVIGVTLLLFLYLKIDILLFAFIGLMFFEAITNFRVPRLITMVRYGKEAAMAPELECKFRFEAERVFRLIIAILLVITCIIIPNEAWFFPWFLGAMVGLAGAINLCPMLIAIKWIGFR